MVPILVFFIAIQSVNIQSGILEETNFCTGYLFGTVVGTCALAGACVVAKQLTQGFTFNPFRATKIQNNLSDMSLRGYIGNVPQEVADLIGQLRNVEEYEKMGVKVTKGLIFFGEPGSGKTHLARSIAAEIDCPFFAANATDFKQSLVGEGKNVIKDLFERAREGARQHASRVAIVFIDEFDAVGTRIGNKLEGGVDEIINTLLNEMDGFDGHNDAHVVVIAATNLLDNIDPALKRSGRFDHKIYVSYPDLHGRILFMKNFLEKYPSDSMVSCIELAKQTEGLSPADFVLLFELAGRIAVRSQKSKRDAICFAEALKQIKMNRI